MTKAYRLPVLLIEFDRDRAFALQVCSVFVLLSVLAPPTTRQACCQPDNM
jgi:hypothetical protein